jgi:ribosome-associated translation inhibitor RaiA
MATGDPYPVLCDRCGAEGIAGEAEFERLAGLGDLLDFEPVPRRVARADGWTPEIQSAYVAALAVTGSERQACAVVQRAPWGVQRLREADGSEGFVAACDKAMEIYQERERVRRADSLLAAARGEAARRGRGRPRLAWSNAASRRLTPPEPELPPGDAGDPTADEEKLKLSLLEVIVHKYMLKLEAERRCRLEGRIAEADFYIRQVTMLEVSLDVLADGNGMEVLKQARRDGHDLLHIAETELSKLLDRARRLHWQDCGDPPRPGYPPRHLLVEHDGFATEPLEGPPTDMRESWQERLSRLERQHERDAKAQVEWEAEARRDYERRRDSDADS